MCTENVNGNGIPSQMSTKGSLGRWSKNGKKLVNIVCERPLVVLGFHFMDCKMHNTLVHIYYAL